MQHSLTSLCCVLIPLHFLTFSFLLQCWWGSQKIFGAQVPQATAPSQEEEAGWKRCSLWLSQCKTISLWGLHKFKSLFVFVVNDLHCFAEASQGHSPQTHWPHGDLIVCAREHHQWHAGSSQCKINQTHSESPHSFNSKFGLTAQVSQLLSPPLLCRHIPSTHPSMPRLWRTTTRSSRGQWTYRRWEKMYVSECTHQGRNSVKQWKLSSKTAPPTMVTDLIQFQSEFQLKWRASEF